MSVESVENFEAALTTIDINDGTAVRALAQRLEALGDEATATDLCARSRALRAAVGRLRAEALSALLARDERDEFIKRTADVAYMGVVDLDAMRVPRYVAIDRHACACGAQLMVPYFKQGGPGFGFDCPACGAPYLARHAYGGHEYRVEIEADTRPAKKRRRRPGVF